MQSGASLKKENRFVISINQIIDFLSMACLLLFSARECMMKLFPFLPYMAFTYLVFLLLVFFLLLEQKRINYKALIFLLAVIVVCFLNWELTNGHQKEYIYGMLIDPLAFIRLWVYFVVFSIVRDPKSLRKTLVIIAYANVLLLIFTVFRGVYGERNNVLNYVGLGISGAMWIPVIILEAFILNGRKRTIHTLASVVFIAFIAVYGNRGSLVAILAFIVFCFFKYTKVKRKTFISIIIILVASLVYSFQDELRNFIITKISSIGIFSRNLNLLISGRLGYTTHRTDEIWVKVARYIKERPFTGYGLCYDRILGGNIDVYAHNLVLEVLLSFGVIIGLVLLGLHVAMGIKNCFYAKDRDWEYLFTPFYITTTVLLMFNNSFCMLGFFWISYGLHFAMRKGKKTKN